MVWNLMPHQSCRLHTKGRWKPPGLKVLYIAWALVNASIVCQHVASTDWQESKGQLCSSWEAQCPIVKGLNGCKIIQTRSREISSVCKIPEINEKVWPEENSQCVMQAYRSLTSRHVCYLDTSGGRGWAFFFEYSLIMVHSNKNRSSTFYMYYVNKTIVVFNVVLD